MCGAGGDRGAARHVGRRELRPPSAKMEETANGDGNRTPECSAETPASQRRSWTRGLTRVDRAGHIRSGSQTSKCSLLDRSRYLTLSLNRACCALGPSRAGEACAAPRPPPPPSVPSTATFRLTRYIHHRCSRAISTRPLKSTWQGRPRCPSPRTPPLSSRMPPCPS